MNTVKEVYASDRQAWREWLQTNHAVEQAIWLIYDKGAGRRLSYDAIVEEALCFGWIDGRAGTVNETQSKLHISRRKPKSAWSKSNKARIVQLRANGLMTAAGDDAIARAHANGAWHALDASDAALLPPELTHQLAANPAAHDFFHTLAPSSVRLILAWIYAAKTDTTRQKRITETVALAAQGIKAHH